MKRIYLSGGFHNSKETYVSVSDKVYNDFGDAERTGSDLCGWIQDNLTKYQEKRLYNHFCGIKGCTCGSYARANAYKK